jgi:hypothetical protein
MNQTVLAKGTNFNVFRRFICANISLRTYHS